MTTMKETLDKRGKRYGDFARMSACINDLQRIIGLYQEDTLTEYQYHGLNMIMVKIGRILTGDPDYDDNWRDIAGYALKVLDNLPKDLNQEESPE